MRGRLALIIGSAKTRAYFTLHFPYARRRRVVVSLAAPVPVPKAKPVRVKKKRVRIPYRIPPELFTKTRPDKKRK